MHTHTYVAVTHRHTHITVACTHDVSATHTSQPHTQQPHMSQAHTHRRRTRTRIAHTHVQPRRAGAQAHLASAPCLGGSSPRPRTQPALLGVPPATPGSSHSSGRSCQLFKTRKVLREQAGRVFSPQRWGDLGAPPRQGCTGRHPGRSLGRSDGAVSTAF